MNQAVYYIGGCSAQGNLSAVAIGLTAEPEAQMALLQATAPFHHLALLGIEVGTEERLEAIRKQFQMVALAGPWYKYTEELEKLVKGLPPMAFNKKSTRRVSLDLEPEEWALLESMVGPGGRKSKVLRKALQAYRVLREYQEQGYRLQAVRGGETLQFPTIDDLKGP